MEEDKHTKRIKIKGAPSIVENPKTKNWNIEKNSIS
jgi:hypothetical protein